MKNFVHSIGIEWTRVLKKYTNVKFPPSLISDGFEYQKYPFPDEDFCMFSDCPHEKVIMPCINYNVPKCTNKIKWLIQNYELYNKSNPYFSFKMF
jgi:hypothetical protein